jgi:hypothetical protein
VHLNPNLVKYDLDISGRSGLAPTERVKQQLQRHLRKHGTQPSHICGLSSGKSLVSNNVF